MILEIVMLIPRSKNNTKRKETKYEDLARELKKTMEHEIDGDTSCKCNTWNDPQMRNNGLKAVEHLEKQRTSRNHPKYSIIKIGQNTEKSPGDS